MKNIIVYDKLNKSRTNKLMSFVTALKLGFNGLTPIIPQTISVDVEVHFKRLFIMLIAQHVYATVHL